MPGYTDAKSQSSSIQALEKELHLKQLQINRLLNITQAINNNIPAEGLYDMYKSFLSWEIGVKKMALFVREEEDWTCACTIDPIDDLQNEGFKALLPTYTKIKNINEEDHEMVRTYDVVIPVRHKEHAIAYVFIGGFTEDEDMYNKVQFITTITNVVAVAIENKRLFKRQLEQERLRREMELAAEVQQMLIPKKLPHTQEYEFDCIYKPQLSVGGDYFDFIEIEDDKLVFCIGDFTGKGVGAALLMANFQANFHTLINNRAGIDEFVRGLNQSVNLITKGDRFITFFIAEYDKRKRQLRYINAGHNPPVLATRDRMVLLNKGSIMLGSYEELPEVEVGYCDIEEEAIIFSFTDGLTDIRNEKGEFLQEQGLIEFVRANYQLSSRSFNEKLLGYIDDHRGQESFPDDFTVLTCKVYCPGQANPC